MQSRILLRGYAREGGTPSLATHPQNQQQHQEQNQNQEQHQNQNQNQNQLQNQGRLHRGLDTPPAEPRLLSVYRKNLPSRHQRFRPILPAVTRFTWSRTDPTVSGSSIPSEVIALHDPTTHRRVTFLLFQDSASAVSRRLHSLSQVPQTTSHHPQP